MFFDIVARLTSLEKGTYYRSLLKCFPLSNHVQVFRVILGAFLVISLTCKITFKLKETFKPKPFLSQKNTKVVTIN